MIAREYEKIMINAFKEVQTKWQLKVSTLADLVAAVQDYISGKRRLRRNFPRATVDKNGELLHYYVLTSDEFCKALNRNIKTGRLRYENGEFQLGNMLNKLRPWKKSNTSNQTQIMFSASDVQRALDQFVDNLGVGPNGPYTT